jgi:hypothetical protein
MQEIRYDSSNDTVTHIKDQMAALKNALGRNDRITPKATPEDIARAIADEATKLVLLHKPGTTFKAYAHGEYKTYFVLEDGSLEERPDRAERRRRAKNS